MHPDVAYSSTNNLVRLVELVWNLKLLVKLVWSPILSWVDKKQSRVGFKSGNDSNLAFIVSLVPTSASTAILYSKLNFEATVDSSLVCKIYCNL